MSKSNLCVRKILKGETAAEKSQKIPKMKRSERHLKEGTRAPRPDGCPLEPMHWRGRYKHAGRPPILGCTHSMAGVWGVCYFQKCKIIFKSTYELCLRTQPEKDELAAWGRQLSAHRWQKRLLLCLPFLKEMIWEVRKVNIIKK